MRKALHALGFRYILKSKLPGRPDLVFPSRHVVLFVDGCFWHRCPEHGVLPTTKPDWWREKLEANVRRDREAEARLAKAGWKVIRVWEHDVRRNLPHAVDRVARALKLCPRRGLQ